MWNGTGWPLLFPLERADTALVLAALAARHGEGLFLFDGNVVRCTLAVVAVLVH